MTPVQYAELGRIIGTKDRTTTFMFGGVPLCREQLVDLDVTREPEIDSDKMTRSMDAFMYYRPGRYAKIALKTSDDRLLTEIVDFGENRA